MRCDGLVAEVADWAAGLEEVHARIDALGVRLDARIDALDSRLTSAIDGISNRLDTHVERHAG